MAANTLLRFTDLQARGIVSNRPQLTRLINQYGFPPGFLLSANARCWEEDEVVAWLEKRRQASALTHLAVA